MALVTYQVDLPPTEGRCPWSNENAVTVFGSTVVVVETDAGIMGYGECCLLGPAYLPAYAAGVRSGLAELTPKLLGANPTHLRVPNGRMDVALRGHPYVKAPIDMACRDILGKVAQLPLYALLGGAEQEAVQLYRAISQDSPEAMAGQVGRYRADGYTKFQMTGVPWILPDCAPGQRVRERRQSV